MPLQTLSLLSLVQLLVQLLSDDSSEMRSSKIQEFIKQCESSHVVGCASLTQNLILDQQELIGACTIVSESKFN